MPVQVEWKPFQIDPGTASEGEDFEAYCRRRWGSSGWTNHLRREGKKDGANFADWKWFPNTLKGHQFIQYALEKHQVPTDQTNAILFQAVYEQGENISLTETLLKIARTHFPSWDNDEIEGDLRTYLDENQGAVQIQQEIAKGRRQYNIKGVPFFVVEPSSPAKKKQHRPYGLSGAQPPEAFMEVFEQVAGEMDDD